VLIQLGNGRFEPGRVAEPTGTSEIEFDGDLGDGPDFVDVHGPTTAQTFFRYGELPGGLPGFNLNAPEAGGPDGDDIAIQGVDFASTFIFSNNDDVLDAGGGPEFMGAFPRSVSALTSGGKDTITAGAAGGFYDADDGNDTLISGSSAIGEDVLRGDADEDTVSYDRATAGVTVALNVAIDQVTGGAGTDKFDQTDIENLTGSPFGDGLTGSNVPNKITGGNGQDSITALDGNDEIFAIDGESDTINCGPGAGDVAHVDLGAQDTVDPSCETTVIDPVPDTTITRGPTGTIGPAPVAYAFSASKPGSTFRCSLDGAPFSGCSSPLELGTLADGGHQFAVASEDQFGNVDPTPATGSFTVDATSPDTTVGKPKVKGRRAKLKLTSTEPGSTFLCRVDKKAFKPCTSPFRTKKLKPGRHKVRVQAADSTGNTDATPDSRSFRI
jgi:hypothetical protein